MYNGKFNIELAKIKEKIPHYLLVRYLNLSYRTNFIKLDLISAYSSRILYFIHLSFYHNNNLQLVELANYYLENILSESLIKYFDKKIDLINNYNINKIKSLSTNYHDENRNGDSNRIKLFIFGPGSKDDDFQYFPDRTLLLFKPDARAKLYGKNTFLFLSYAHLEYLEDEVNEAFESDMYSKIFLRGDIPKKFLYHKKTIRVSENNNFPGLLSINRLFITLYDLYSNIDLIISGINFYLSSTPYNQKYKNAVNKYSIFSRKKRSKKTIFENLINHDILFNFIFAKKYLRNNSVVISQSNQFKNIMQLTPEEFCKQFILTYK